MKANEFIKKYGLDYAYKFLNYNASIAEDRCVLDFGEYHNLKRIVKSHELVVQCGGLEDARSHLESIRFNIATKTWFGQALLNWSMYADKLEKAIADVESCM